MHQPPEVNECAVLPQKQPPLDSIEPDFGWPSSSTKDPLDFSLASLASSASDQTSPYRISSHREDPPESSSSQKICYGALCHVKAHIDSDPRKVNPVEKCGFKRFGVSQRNSAFCLVIEEQNVASLNLKASSGLLEIVDLGVEMHGFVQSKVWVSKLSDFNKQSKKRTAIVEADIIIYGNPENSNAVGRHLSNSKLFLQPPEPVQMEAEVYQNPHWLHLPESNPSSTQLLDAQEDVSDLSFFNNTPQVATLQEVQIDPRVTTPLQPHQKTGVDFIVKKETASLDPSMNLWQARQNEAGMPYYAHILTGSTQDKSLEESEGGILADDVGLGKTLTMLSAIVGSMNRGTAFASSKVSEHRLIDSTLQSCSATLIIVPSGLILDGWEKEIEKHVRPGTLKVHKYHGWLKEIDYPTLKDKDVVLTTYSTVESDARLKGHHFFQNINWFRVVLDEAHVIRTHSTKQFAAVNSIKAVTRWCLTGTPMQNRLQDFGTLLKFLKIPFLDEKSTFRKLIAEPQERDTPDYTNLRVLLGSLCLRRGRQVLTLPEPCVPPPRVLRMSPPEEERYNEIKEACDAVISKAEKNQSQSEIQKAFLIRYMRLRMACNHGTFEPPPSKNHGGILQTQPSESSSMNSPISTGEVPCPTCFQDLFASHDKDASRACLCGSCVGKLCPQCFPEYGVNTSSKTLSGRQRCTACGNLCSRNTEPASRFQFEGMSDEDMDAGQCTKLNTVVDDIENHRKSCNALVFSCWKTTLLLLAHILVRRGIKAEFIHGEVPLQKRKSILNKFRNADAGNVLLMTLGTGAVGLNLFTARRIHIIEPQWNPAVEAQAIGRAVRLGQTAEVTIVKYVMGDTIERDVRSRQKHKLQLASAFGKQGNDKDGIKGIERRFASGDRKSPP